MIISQETIKKLKDLGYVVWGQKGIMYTDEGLTYEEADTLVVSMDFVFNNLKTPKYKEVTLEWVLDKINKGNSYKNLSQYLRKVFGYSIDIYPTSYGIGIDTLFGKYENRAKMVAEKLSELGLKFRNEFSDAGWVYRFIVSKDRDNMKILESLK